MVSMAVIVPSATPPQFDSVGLWVTRMPSFVAVSTSTSSTPIVYLATMRSRSELCMIAPVMGELRMEVPTRASQPAAMRAISASLFPCGVSQEALPRISSHPWASSVLCVSREPSAGAKTKTLADFMTWPPYARRQPYCIFHRGFKRRRGGRRREHDHRRRSSMQHPVRVFIAGGLALLLAGSLTQPAHAQAPPIKIRVVFPLTGPISAQGIPERDAIKQAFDEENYQVAGRKIELVIEDSQGKPDVALTKFRKVVEGDRVHLLLSELVSSVGAAVAP